MEERNAWRDGVPKYALKLPFRGATVRELSIEALKIASAGLARRARANTCGMNEACFLESIIEIAESGETAAERKLDLFHGPWGGVVDPVFKEFAY
jgi:glutamate--cysteine ligase